MRSKLRLVGEVARFFGNDDEDAADGGADDTKECTSCGEDIPDDAKKCPECGAMQKTVGDDKKNPFAGGKKPDFAKKSKKKMDAADADFDSLFDKDDRDLMLGAIKLHAPNFDATDKSDDYVRSRYDALLDTVKASRGIDGVRAAIEVGGARLDGEDKNDTIAKAKQKQFEAARDAHKMTDATRNGGQ